MFSHFSWPRERSFSVNLAPWQSPNQLASKKCRSIALEYWRVSALIGKVLIKEYQLFSNLSCLTAR